MYENDCAKKIYPAGVQNKCYKFSEDETKTAWWDSDTTFLRNFTDFVNKYLLATQR